MCSNDDSWLIIDLLPQGQVRFLIHLRGENVVKPVSQNAFKTNG